MQRARLAGVVILLALSGCENDENDENDNTTGDAATAESAEVADKLVDGGLSTIDASLGDDASVESFQALYSELIAPRCQDCHGTVDGGRTSARLALVPKEVALEQLINKPALGRSCLDAGFPLVTPGKPDQSLFLLKLDPDPRCGTRMPRALDGGTPDFFSDSEVLRIRRWIEQGAQNN